MYTRDQKPFREEKHNKSKKTHKDTPSFSSTLLDEIYRSIDGGVEQPDDFKPYREKLVKKQSGGYRAKTNIIEDDDTRILIRARLVEKWMEKEKLDKNVPNKCPNMDLDNKSLQDNNNNNNNNDLLFFSSTSSSNSDSSGALSSSDTEFFGTQTEPKVSCFSSRPKPVRTGVSVREGRNNARDGYSGDCQSREKSKLEDDVLKYKSRALKMYANLKKIKQPISPGGRLTSFINSLFSNGSGKKSKNADTSRDFKAQSTCSSASSFSRSCLSKYSPRSRERMRGVDQRTVRFHPVSVIVDEDSRPCGQKCIDAEEIGRYDKKPPLPTNDLKLRKMEKNRKVEEDAKRVLKGYNGKFVRDFSVFRKINSADDVGDDDDVMSDSSSDLFELDLFSNNRFCEELPVYETTRLETNRAIASRLIR